MSCDGVGYWLYKSMCLGVCPTGYSQSGAVCAITSTLASSVVLNGETSYSTIGSYDCGSDHVQYDVNDPLPALDRGYYFTPNNYMSTQIILSPDLCINMWVNVQGSGVLISNGLITITISGSNLIISATLDYSSISVMTVIVVAVWSYVSFEILVPLTSLSSLQVYVNSVLETSSSALSNSIYRGPSSTFLLGDTAVGFTGFIWSIYIYNENSHIGDNIATTGCASPCASCPQQLICPSTCPFNNPPNDCSAVCPSLCLMCSQAGTCDYLCYPNIIIDAFGTCSCPTGTTWDSTTYSCLSCYNNCATCDINNLFACTSCLSGYLMLGPTCRIECPTGFISSLTDCIAEQSLAFDMKFDEIQGIVYDKTNEIPAITGSSKQFYPDYEENDPYAAYERGYYFNGVKSILRLPEFEYTAPYFTLSPEFSIELWIMPVQGNGTIISKQRTTDYLSTFELTLYNSVLQLSALTSSHTSKVWVIQEILLETWSYFGISMKYLGSSGFDLYYCYNYATFDKGSNLLYIDDVSSGFAMTIGAKKLSQTSYSGFFGGFIYEIRIYSSAIAFPITRACTGCSVSSSAGGCLPDCGISRYWNGTCELCDPACIYGCRDLANSCSLCNNILCGECTDYEYCETCVDGAESTQGLCNCMVGYLQNDNSCSKCKGVILENVCVECPEGCQECNDSGCIICEGQMTLSNGICRCDLGYEGDNCTQTELYLNISINTFNIVFLLFSEDLQIDLSLEDMYISSPGLNLVLSMTEWTPAEYLINITASTDIKAGTELFISFTSNIYSQSFSNLLVTNYTLQLEGVNATVPSPLVESFESAAKIASTVLIASATSMSFASFNPLSIWSFVSAIQLLVYIYLANIPFSSRTKGFLIGLRKYNSFPDLFGYMGVYQGKSHQFPRANDLGFLNNSVLLNVGNFLSLFLCLLFIYFILRFIYWATAFRTLSENKLRKFIKEYCDQYNYGFYIRFWIQSYIEFLVACMITVYSSDFTTLSQAYNFYLATILMVTYI